MSNICKTVTLRTRKIKKGTQLSFYLDYYPGYRDESTMKATIERGQCQTRLNIAEREWVRPKVKVQRHESLGIYIYAKPKSQREKDYNDRMTEKVTIKQEQCQTRLSIAEREWLRPKVKAEALRCRRYESIVNERYDFFDKEKMKATIGREQCQTRLSIAEREWLRA